MNSAAAISSSVEHGSQPGERAHVLACAFCRKRLGGEYFFTCRKCDASYCYIHISRHQPDPCARQEGRRRRRDAEVAPNRPRHGLGQEQVTLE